jgi:hypothetical protein
MSMISKGLAIGLGAGFLLGLTAGLISTFGYMLRLGMPD